MSRFIQSLEPRTLLSATVTKATLLADRAALLAEAKSARGGLTALVATLTHDTKTVQTDLKGGPKTDATLLKTLRTDEGATKALVHKDLNALLGPSQALANRTIGQGLASMSHSNATLQAKIAADLAQLATVTAAPLAKLSADLQAATVGADLQAIGAANPANATLVADIAKLESDVSTAGGTLSTAATSFQTGVSTASSDVAAAPAGPTGPTGSTIPTITGSYSGSATATAGNHVGRVQSLHITISTESAAGALTGSAVVQGSNGTSTQTLTGTVDANGTFTATVVDPTDPTNGATLSGHVSGHTITGTYQSTGDSGTFTVTKQ